MFDMALQKDELIQRVTQVLYDLLSEIPGTTEASASDPVARSRSIKKKAAAQAALVAGSLSLPPGPARWLTILPELAFIWGIQKQMVVDIAAAFGKQAQLGPEQMIYCLFKHSAAQAVCELLVKTGRRVLVKRTSLRVIQKVLEKIGIKVTQRLIGRAITRWLPGVGSLAVAAFAYKDTRSVAETAIDLFQLELATVGV